MDVNTRDPAIAAYDQAFPDKDMAIGSPLEGAAEFDRMLRSWFPSRNSADRDMLPQKELADVRARDITRNDAYLQSGANTHRDGIVGAMFALNHKPNLYALGIKDDEVWEQETQEEVESKFTLAAESPQCWMDASRSTTFTGGLRLAVSIYGITGEYLETVEWIRDSARPFRTAFQAVDLDRLETPKIGAGAMDPLVRGGVRVDSRGAPQGYYIRNAHPSDIDQYNDVNQWSYVPIRKPWGRFQCVHLREQNRPFQTRAVADIVAALKEMKMTKKYRDITLQSAVVNAMYAASLESDMMPDAAYAAMGAGAHGDAGDLVAKYGAKYLSAMNSFMGEQGVRIGDVKIPVFFPGTKLNFQNSKAPGGVGQEFEQSLLRYIAAALNLSYEELSRDFSKVNYSSARAAMLQTWRFQSGRKAMFADRLATIRFMLWFEEMMNAGNLECMKYSKLPNYYDPLMAEAFTSCTWIGAGRGQIDELKETQAAVLKVKMGLSTYEEELAKTGKDWRQVFRQLAREKKIMTDLGIEPPEKDNSMNAASGSPRSADSSEGAEHYDFTNAL